MKQSKTYAFIGFILIMLASLAEPADLNKIIFGFGLCMSFQYAVKEFTLFLIWYAYKTSKRKIEIDPLANSELIEIAKKL
jgi:hypothetical protein